LDHRESPQGHEGDEVAALLRGLRLGFIALIAAVITAGLVIGLTLALIHIVVIPVTGTSVNPARTIAPNLYVGGQAVSQLWLFIVAPLLGGAVAGLLFKSGLFAADD